MKVIIDDNHISIEDNDECKTAWLEGFDVLTLFFNDKPSRKFRTIDTGQRLVIFSNVDALELE